MNRAVLAIGIGLAMAGAIAAYAAGRASASGPKVLQAERLELLDSGVVTASLRGSPDGLGICDPKGRLRAIVGMPAGGAPALGLLDESGRCRISLDMTSDGQAELDLFGGTGEPPVSLIAAPDGRPDLSLKRRGGGVIISLDEAGRLVLYTGCGETPTVLWSRSQENTCPQPGTGGGDL
jgi:hypothetical protein